MKTEGQLECETTTQKIDFSNLTNTFIAHVYIK